MDIQDLLYKRILVVEKNNNYRSNTEIKEIKIIEVSPSKAWVKIQDMNGMKFWKTSSDIVPVEVLATIVDKP